MATGWIKLHRKLMDSPMWTAEPFTKGQAWVDLLMLAQYEDVNNLRKGSVYKSKNFLANRWKWDRRKVDRFLDDLEHGTRNGASIRTINRAKNGTIVTIENWAKYQVDGTRDGTRKCTRNCTENGIQNKNIRNIASEGGLNAPSLATRASDGISYRKVKNENGDWEMVPVKGGGES